jgi:Na+/H+ antiporter NhaD/arsenite permease-like protein
LKSARIYKEIDWSLLMMFAGLFIIVAGAERTLLTPEVFAAVGRLHLDNIAGNFTVLGSIANLIVVQRAAVDGVKISFWDYFKVGAPLTVITLVIGRLWLWL